MNANRDIFNGFLDDDYDNYIRKMSRFGIWGGHTEIFAFCKVFGMKVEIYHNGIMDETYLPNENQPNLETIRLHYDGAHYNSIVPKNNPNYRILTTPTKNEMEEANNEMDHILSNIPLYYDSVKNGTPNKPSDDNDDNDDGDDDNNNNRKNNYSNCNNNNRKNKDIIEFDDAIVDASSNLEYQIVKHEIDGNSLFESISHQLYGDTKYHILVRKKYIY